MSNQGLLPIACSEILVILKTNHRIKSDVFTTMLLTFLDKKLATTLPNKINQYLIQNKKLPHLELQYAYLFFFIEEQSKLESQC